MTEQLLSSPSTPEPSRSWRPQISLAMMIALVTIVALGFGYYVLSYRFAQKIEKANAENALLKNQIIQFKKDLAILEVTDPNLIHAIQLPIFENDTYRYRVHIPPNKKYILRCKVNEIPKDGIPTDLSGQVTETPIDASSFTSEDNEITLQVRNRSVELRTPQLHAQAGIDKTNRNGLGVSTSTGVTQKEISIEERGKPFVLLKHRSLYSKTKKSLSSSDIPDPSPGLLLWIEEVKDRITDEPVKM